jgi:exodeoxyribonuclease VII large subunit
MALAKRALEPLSVRVVGEVTELTDRPGYKAVYFSLADDSATASCLIWRDAFERCGVPLRCGMLVQADGAMTVYAPKGRMQFQVRSIAPAGEGLLRLQVAELARRLAAEGLMDPTRKRAVPPLPERIGLVTSPRGKAVHDVVRTLQRRFPAAQLVFAGVTVEGPDAPAEIVAGLAAVAEAGVDVVVLARGGGSYEDLMPFNSEVVARSIIGSPAPVVTGIGHEPDTSIADMVADISASTPTAAAETVSPSCDEIEARLTSMASALGRALLHRLRDAQHRLRLLERAPVLADARGWLAVRAQATDLAADALDRAGSLSVARASQRFATVAARMVASRSAVAGPSAARLAQATASLEALSPLAVLERGYAVVHRADGSIARDAAQLARGELITTRLCRGTVVSAVQEVDQ